jgi:transposase
MLSARTPARKRSTRDPFLCPLWDNDHPDFRRIDHDLPEDHHARWLLLAVSRLDLEPLRRAYANRGSRAYPPEQLLPFVLLMYAQKLLSPTEWARQASTNDVAKWLLRGLRPRRSALYAFRDRSEPFLDAWHKQLIDWAIAEGITTAKRGSLDGSFIAALSSRHRLLSARVLDGRLLLLRLAVWVETHSPEEVETLLAVVLTTASLFPAQASLCLLLAVLVLLLLLLLHPSFLQAAREQLCSRDSPGSEPSRSRADPRQAIRAEILPAWLPASVAGRQRMLARYEKAQKRLAQRLLPYQGKKRLSAKDEKAIKRAKINPSDAEAALGWDKVGTFRPLYNLQLVRATDAPLTLSWELFSSNNDEGMLRPMMKQTKKQIGHHLSEVLVDGSYASIGDARYCEKKGILVYAPPAKEDKAKSSAAGEDKAQTGASGAAVGVASPAPQASRADSANAPTVVAVSEVAAAAAAKAEAESGSLGGGKRSSRAKQGAKGAKGVKKYPKEKFRYEPEQKVYHCPAGKVLPEVFRTKEKRQGGMELTVLVHRAEAADCQECGQRGQCTTGKQGRVVKRYEGEEVLERLTQRMQEPANQKIYRLRSQTVEQGYADLKEHRGLRVFRSFEKNRSRAQAGLTLLGSNALGIVRILRRREKEPPPLSPNEKQAS